MASGMVTNTFAIKIDPESLETIKKRRIADFSSKYFGHYLVVFNPPKGNPHWLTYPAKEFEEVFSFVTSEETAKFKQVVVKV